DLERRLRDLLATGEIRGEVGESAVLRLASGRIAAAGIGRPEQLDADAFRTAAAAAARAVDRLGGTGAWVPDQALPLPEAEPARPAGIAADSAHVTAGARGPEQLDGRGMGAFAAVARASHNPPRLIVLRYDPREPRRPDVVLGLVGKAITFDSGGISLKPALKMEDMKGDMAGGAAVVEGLAAVAELGLPVRAVAVVASCE